MTETEAAPEVNLESAPNEQVENTCPQKVKKAKKCQNQRTDCLARPKKDRITPKFQPESHDVLQYKKRRSITVKEASKNWRINQLAIPTRRREKYVPPTNIITVAPPPLITDEEHPCYQKPTALSPGEIATISKKSKNCLKEQLEILEREIPERVDHMARNNIRYLLAQRRIFGKFLGPKFVQKMNERIDLSWNSIYNYYKKCEETQRLEKEEKKRRRLESRRAAKVAAKAEKGKGKKGKGKKGSKKAGDSTSEKSSMSNLSKEERIQKWCILRAQPKKRYPPAPLPPRKHGDLAKLVVRCQKLAKPKYVYVPPDKDPELLRLFKVSPKALKYVATDKIKLMAQVPEVRMIKEEIPIPGAVKPDALTYVATPRILALAIPKKRSSAPGESEIKQDAFVVSPAALKYVATPRILDLARPLERA